MHEILYGKADDVGESSAIHKQDPPTAGFRKKGRAHLRRKLNRYVGDESKRKAERKLVALWSSRELASKRQLLGGAAWGERGLQSARK